MQPYPYAPYPNAVPVSYPPPVVYQPHPAPYVAPGYDPYAVAYDPYAVAYDPRVAGYASASNASYTTIAPPMKIKQPQVDRRQFQNPPAAAYYPNGAYPAAPANSNGRRNGPTKPSVSDQRRKLFDNLAKDSNIDALFKEKGTTVNASKVYRVRRPKPGFQDDSDNEFEPVPIEPSRPMPLMQPAMPFQQPRMTVQRIPSASSVCSDCSECNRNRSPNGNSNCPDCNTEWRNGQNQNKRDNWN